MIALRGRKWGCEGLLRILFSILHSTILICLFFVCSFLYSLPGVNNSAPPVVVAPSSLPSEGPIKLNRSSSDAVRNWSICISCVFLEEPRIHFLCVDCDFVCISFWQPHARCPVPSGRRILLRALVRSWAWVCARLTREHCFHLAHFVFVHTGWCHCVHILLRSRRSSRRTFAHKFRWRTHGKEKSSTLVIAADGGAQIAATSAAVAKSVVPESAHGSTVTPTALILNRMQVPRGPALKLSKNLHPHM
jgi:hypothetical protein